MRTSFLLALVSSVLASSLTRRPRKPTIVRTDKVLSPILPTTAEDSSSMLDPITFPDYLIEGGSQLSKRGDDSDSINYIQLSQKMFNAQNRARENPIAFAGELERYGDAEAAAVCKTASPNKAYGNMIYTPNLRKAAQLLWEMQGPVGALGHTGTDGSSPYDRMSKFGKWHSIAGENIMYGASHEMAIMAALIKSPSHFDNIFRKEFFVAGMSCGPHSTYRVQCVMLYAGSFTDNVEEKLR